MPTQLCLGRLLCGMGWQQATVPGHSIALRPRSRSRPHSPVSPPCRPPRPAAEVIKSCRFLGRAEMALSDTWLSSLKIWLPLMRCDAGDTVRLAAVFVS